MSYAQQLVISNQKLVRLFPIFYFLVSLSEEDFDG